MMTVFGDGPFRAYYLQMFLNFATGRRILQDEMLQVGFEPRVSCVRSYPSNNCATTTFLLSISTTPRQEYSTMSVFIYTGTQLSRDCILSNHRQRHHETRQHWQRHHICIILKAWNLNAIVVGELLASMGPHATETTNCPNFSSE